MEQSPNIEITKTKRKIELDILKGIGIIFVIIGHIIPIVHGEGHENVLLFKIAYSFHMPLLIAISGYLTGISKNQTYDFNWLKKKTIRLLVPNFIWTATAILIIRLDFIKYMFINPYYWFLPCLWAFNLVLYISKKTRHGFVVVSFFFMCFFLLAMAMKNVDNLFSRNLFLFFWYFFAGFFLSKKIQAIAENKKLCIILCVVSLVLYSAAVSFACFGLEDFYTAVLCKKFNIGNKLFKLAIEGTLYLYNYFFLSILGITFFSTCIVLCIRFFNERQKKIPLFFSFLSTAGKYSLQIYVIHMFFIHSYTQSTYVNYLLSFGLGLAVPLVFGFIIGKVPRLNRLLFG